MTTNAISRPVFSRVILGVILTFFALLQACSDSSEITVDNGQFSASISMPEQLRSVRGLDDAQLSVRVNGSEVEATQDLDTLLWSAKFTVALGRQHRINLRWSDNELDLMEAVDWFSTSTASPVNIAFQSDQFDSSFDLDDDGGSNLFELKQGTNPAAFNDPEQAIEQVILNVELASPQVLTQVEQVSFDNVVFRVAINNLALQLTRQENGVWSGNRAVSANHPLYVTVEWCYRLSNNDRLRLARYARTIEISDGTDLALPDLENLYRTDYDLDSNGVNNLQEIANGTVPLQATGSAACT